MARTTKKASQEQITLSASARKETGKQVKKLRKEGKIPANIFGQDFQSLAITLDYKDFVAAYKAAGATGIVYVHVDKDSIPTLVAHVQRHPVIDTFLHIDFRKVNLKQKIETPVPVLIVGQSEAVNVKGGILLTQATDLTVEALPTDIPQHIEVDIASLKEIGQDIKVKDLIKSSAYEIKEDPEKVIVSVTEHKEESVVPETEPTAAPEITTAKPEEGAEGETGAPAESGAAPATEEEKK